MGTRKTTGPKKCAGWKARGQHLSEEQRSELLAEAEKRRYERCEVHNDGCLFRRNSAVTQHVIDQAGQMVRHGNDGFGSTKFGFQGNTTEDVLGAAELIAETNGPAKRMKTGLDAAGLTVWFDMEG
jgi:hypothetical protein